MQIQWGFRPGTRDDLPEVVRIESVSNPSPWSLESFQKELEKPYSHLLVLTDDETDSKIAGFAVFWMMFDECEILEIAVDEPYRRKGFGKKIIQQVVRAGHRQKMKRVVLDVRKTNMPAIELYQNCHFTITNIRKGFYTNGEDAYHMVLSLEGDDLTTELL